MKLTKKAIYAIEKDIMEWNQRIFWSIDDLKNCNTNEQRRENIQSINFFMGRLLGIQDTLVNLNSDYKHDFETLYNNMKKYIVKNIYNSDISYIIGTEYQYTAFGQFYSVAG